MINNQCWLRSDACSNDELTPMENGFDLVKIDEEETCERFQPLTKYKYCSRPQMICSGGDYKKVITDNEPLCRYWCRFYQNCVGTNYHKINKHCWLEQYKCASSVHSLAVDIGGYDDYVKVPINASCREYVTKNKYCRITSNLSCVGQDYQLIYPGTEDKCREFCDLRKECRSYHWANNKNCWLKKWACTKSQLTPWHGNMAIKKIYAEDQSCDTAWDVNRGE